MRFMLEYYEKQTYLKILARARLVYDWGQVSVFPAGEYSSILRLSAVHLLDYSRESSSMLLDGDDAPAQWLGKMRIAGKARYSVLGADSPRACRDTPSFANAVVSFPT